MLRLPSNPYPSLLLVAHAFLLSCGANRAPVTTPVVEQSRSSVAVPNSEAMPPAASAPTLDAQVAALFEHRVSTASLGATDLARLAFIERCERVALSSVAVAEECALFLQVPSVERAFLRARTLSALGRFAEARDAFVRVRATESALSGLATLREAEALFETVAFRSLELGERDANLLSELTTLAAAAQLLMPSLERRCQLAITRLRYAFARRDCRQENAGLDAAASQLRDDVQARTANPGDEVLVRELRIFAATAVAARPALVETAALLLVELRREHSSVSARADFQLQELQRRVPANVSSAWIEPTAEKLQRAASEVVLGNRARARELATSILATESLGDSLRCATAIARLEWSDSASERREALRPIDRLCAGDESPKHFFVQGDAQLLLDDDEHGIATLEHAVSLPTDDTGYRDRAALRLVQVHLRNGRDIAAKSVLRCALFDDCASFTTAPNIETRGADESLAPGADTPEAVATTANDVRGGANAEQHELAVLFAVLADAGQQSDAVAVLEQAVMHADERERTEGLLGRAEYWLGKTTSDLDGSRSRALFQHVVDAHGLTFYGHLAARRLGVDAHREHVVAPVEGAMSAAFAQRFRERSTQPAFRLACALLRIGEIELAKEALRLPMPGDEPASDNGLRDGLLHSFLMQRAGYLREGISMARAFRNELSRKPTSDAEWGYLQVAYPKGYASYVEAASALDGVRADLVFAISREESSFDPNALSTASAHGVMQIIEPTARRMASSLGISLSPQLLRDPETNIRLGTRYLRALLQRYEQRHGFVPAAYNAGEGAVDRWLRANASETEFDRWVERIPYTETRRYTRRVLQTLCVYSALSGSDVPTWDAPPSS